MGTAGSPCMGQAHGAHHLGDESKSLCLCCHKGRGGAPGSGFRGMNTVIWPLCTRLLSQHRCNCPWALTTQRGSDP